MQLLCELAICLLDVVPARGASNAEEFVVIALGHEAPSLAEFDRCTSCSHNEKPTEAEAKVGSF